MKGLYSSVLLLGLVANLGLFSQPTLSVDIQENQAVIDYPEEITFTLKASGDEEIESVELIFGSDVITCGESLTRAFPDDYEPSQEVDVEWEWNLRRRGAIPPGTQVWWEWILTDAQGNEVRTPRETLTFTDENIDWQVYSSDSVEIYWTEGDKTFATELAEAGETALDSLFEMTGVEISEVVRVYIYPSAEDMQTATLYAPDWSGGLAFPEYRTVLAGVSPGSLTWGREVVAHELTHVLIEYYSFSCVSGLPVWLNEGLAMTGESSVGVSHDSEYARLNAAIEEDTLLSVREISTSFSNDGDLARLAYAQSYSLVQYLFDEYGQENMLGFLDAFKDGYSQTQALDRVYGLTQDSLENAWRESIGAAPLQGTAVPQATATRTPYPTFPPITGPSVQATSTPTVVEEIVQADPTAALPTPTTEEPPQPIEAETPGFPVSIVFGGVILAVLLTAGFVLIKKKQSVSE